MDLCKKQYQNDSEITIHEYGHEFSNGARAFVYSFEFVDGCDDKENQMSEIKCEIIKKIGMLSRSVLALSCVEGSGWAKETCKVWDGIIICYKPLWLICS